MSGAAVADTRDHKIGDVGLELATPRLTLERWREIGAKIGTFATAINWAMGDWLLAGVELGIPKSELYELASEITGRSFDTLSQCLRVAEAFPRIDRVRGVNWTLHREALRVSPSRRVPLLEEGKAAGWSREQLVVRINRIQGAESKAKTLARAASDPPKRVRKHTGWRPNGSGAWRHEAGIAPLEQRRRRRRVRTDK